MTVSIRRDQRGLGFVALFGIALVLIISMVVAVRVSNQPKKESAVQGQGVSKSNVVDKKLSKECYDVYKDDELCHFIALYKIDNLSYRMTLTEKTDDGTTKSIYDYDGKGNTAVKEGGNDTTYIETKTESFIKDSDDLWYRIPVDESDSEQFVNPLTDAKFAVFKDPDTGSTVKYKQLRKEKCGKLSCFKYQKSSTDLPEVTEQFWFDTEEYLLRRYLYKDADVSNDMTVNYQSVRVSKPSATKELSDFPEE